MSEKSKPPSTDEFCRIVSEANRLKLEGHWHASAFRYHPRGVIRRPYILTDKWNTNGYCFAHVLTEPDAELCTPLDASCSQHNRTFPEPKTGKAICVYDTGRWIADGPWEEALPALLCELEQEIEHRKKIEERLKQARDGLEEEVQQRLQELVTAKQELEKKIRLPGNFIQSA